MYSVCTCSSVGFVCVLCVLVSGGAPGGRRQVGLCVFCVHLLMGVHLEVGIRWVYLDFMFCLKQKSFAVTSSARLAGHVF